MKLGKCVITNNGFSISSDEMGNCELTGTPSGVAFEFDAIEVWKYVDL
jgi:hypothetical protein